MNTLRHDDAAGFRDALVDKLLANRMITTPGVEKAFRTVPRHLFVAEGTPLDVTYDVDSSVAIKHDQDGVIISSTSAAYIQARMLEQAELAADMTVLEIGSGGFNAALAAEVVGPGGRVVSVDIDPEVTDRARELLDATGYGSRVTVARADAENPLPGLQEPFDAILVTVGAWDLAPAWLDQLSERGRIVVPLRMNGITRVVAFRREGDHLVSTSAEVAGFVAMQGDGAHDERVFLLADRSGHHVKLRFDGDVPDDTSLLDGVLATERTDVWSGVAIKHGVSFADLHLWFAAFLPGFCKLAVDEGTDMAAERKTWFPFGVVRGDSFAYLAIRPTADNSGAEFGGRAHGPHGHAAATALVEQIQAWDRLGRDHEPAFAYWPNGSQHPEFGKETAVLVKTHGLATISWPSSSRLTSEYDPLNDDWKSDRVDTLRDSDTADRVDALREEMIAELRKLGAIRSEAVEQAIRTVDRHLFMPEATLEKAYAAEHALVTKRDENGVSISSVSAARIQAFMLEQADIRPGMRVLEIGSGGYNAALIAALVGPDGEVTTIDIDGDVIARAQQLLPAAGYGHVRALVADGIKGEPAHAPYDRIVVTVEAPDLAPAWVDQLAENGRIVVPIRLRGLSWSVAFHREGDELVARDFEVCGFVPMRGAGALDEQLVMLHDVAGEEVGLRVDAGQLDADRMREALTSPRAEAWSGVTLGLGLPYDDLELWLVSSLPEFALLTATREARDRGVVASWSRRGVATLLDHGSGSFAYLTMRPTTPERKVFEFGAVGHGPRAAEAADQLIAQIHTWDGGQRGLQPELRAVPAATRQIAAGVVLERSAFRFTISWPAGR